MSSRRESTMSYYNSDDSTRSEVTMSFASASTVLARPKRSAVQRSEETMSHLTYDSPTLRTEQSMSCSSDGRQRTKRQKSNDNPCVVLKERYKIDTLKRLGGGTFGTVFEGRDQHTRNKVAAKQIDYKSDHGVDNTQLVQIASTELKALQRLSGHPNIVQFYDYYNDRSRSFLWLVIDFCELGDLQSYVPKYNPCFNAKLDIITQSANAICYMHSLKPPIIHRDIKPQNILLKKIGNEIIVKVADFGLSKIFSDVDKFRSHFTMDTFGGTYHFLAPEFFFHPNPIEYHPTVDTFSLGLVFYFLLQFQGEGVLVPHNGAGMPIGQAMFNDVRNGKTLSPMYQGNSSDGFNLAEVKTIINNMVKYSDGDRMNLREVKRRLDELQNTPEENAHTSMANRSSHSVIGKFTWQVGQKCDVTGNVGRVAKMDCCGKRISPSGMIQHLNKAAENHGFEIRCPQQTCQALWYMKDVKEISGLDTSQWDSIETKLQLNELIVCGGLRKCPNCQSLCVREDVSNSRVVCAVCSNFEFCWICSSPWCGVGNVCQNSYCIGLRDQLTGSDKKMISNEEAYCLRTCPNCCILLWHHDKDKRVTCHRCKKRFCFICLGKPKNGRFSCFNVKCNLAAVQKF